MENFFWQFEERSKVDGLREATMSRVPRCNKQKAFPVVWQQHVWLQHCGEGLILIFKLFPNVLHTMGRIATGGQQALHHSWTCCTQVCSTNGKNSTAELLIVKWIQLLLIFIWEFQPTEGVINLDSAFWIVTPLALEQRYRLQEFPALSMFSFLQHCQNI